MIPEPLPRLIPCQKVGHGRYWCSITLLCSYAMMQYLGSMSGTLYLSFCGFFASFCERSSMLVMMWCYQRTFQQLFCSQRINTGRDKHFSSNIIISRWSCTSLFVLIQPPTLLRKCGHHHARPCSVFLSCTAPWQSISCSLAIQCGNTPPQLKALEAYMRHTFVWGKKRITALLANTVST